MQTSLLSFFTKTPKGSNQNPPQTPLRDKGQNEKCSGDSKMPSSSKLPSFNPAATRYPQGSLVWAKLSGYPWWPALVCNHPTEHRAVRKTEIHVQFFDDPVTRSWIDQDMIKPWRVNLELEARGGEALEKGVADAKKVEKLSDSERLDLLLCDLLPSDQEDSEEGEENLSPDGKENIPSKTGEPPRKKRKRIILLESDDSAEDETFAPSKQELANSDEEDDMSEVDEESELESPDEEDSPKKCGVKRKRNGKQTNQKSAKVSGLDTPNSKFGKKLMTSDVRVGSPSLTSPGFFGNKTTSSPLPTLNDGTKKRLAMFGATPSAENETDGKAYKHNELPFLLPDKIKDKEGRRKEDPDYDPKTLHVPESFLRDQTPGQKQWWLLKSQYFDVILFFKMGKFYELFHMDADIGVAELNIVYMKGEVAHAGFPEVAYGRYAATLVEKGYKVARIEQTETPLDMENRCKLMNRPTKFDRVVKREVCQLSTKGTRVNNYLDSETFEGEPRYLLAIAEGPNLVFGVAFVDTTIGIFHLGQFKDDKNLSRLRTLTAHYPPAEVLFEKNGLSPTVYKFLTASLPGVRKEALKAGTEFWEADKALNVLVENSYFATDLDEYWPQGLHGFIDDPNSKMVHPKPDGVFAVRALGAVVWYLSQGFLDQELLSLKKFEEYRPFDHLSSISGSHSNDPVGPKGKHMVLDGITIRNLELVPGQSGDREGTLFARVDSCLTPMGKRTLRNWIVAPLLQPIHIKQRQSVIRELVELNEAGHIRTVLKKVPDLERLISKIHASGDFKRNKSHPDARAVMFEGSVYSKRKIMDLITCLDGLKKIMEIMKMLQGMNFESKILQNITQFEGVGGKFPDLTQILDFYENAFDHNSARKEGKIIPAQGVDQELDNANEQLHQIKRELDDYLKNQKQHFGCEVKYWGTGKNRYQLEIPLEKVKRAGTEYTLASGTKKLKRYTTDETKDFLARQTAREVEKEAALLDIQRKLFYQFSQNAEVLRQAIGCVSSLDALLSLAAYSSSLEVSCFPTFLEREVPIVDVKIGSHPCMDIGGDSFIPNDLLLEDNKCLLVLTGPNMGGKSTLMRQTGLLAILAHLGCMVPAEEMSLTPIDRIFTRLGAQDNIIGGESTFLVELQETSAILQHATRHSLVLVDELGRGTATYDGTAIAGAVVASLARRGSRTLFATHYHNLSSDKQVYSAHMACMVENAGHEDITKESITFLYKLVDGPCPRSHGFNAAKLAGMPDEIIRRGYAKAREFEENEKKRAE